MHYTAQRQLQPVPVPRFISPRKRVPYHHKDVQQLVLQAFQGLLPSVKENADKQIQYEITSQSATGKTQSPAADPCLLYTSPSPRDS